jgi:predicted nucleic acid-binding protein
MAAIFTVCLCTANSGQAIGLATHQSAVAIAHRYGFAFYDALIIASALEAGCSSLLSEDLHDRQVIEDRLTIRNPFV